MPDCCGRYASDDDCVIAAVVNGMAGAFEPRETARNQWYARFAFNPVQAVEIRAVFYEAPADVDLIFGDDVDRIMFGSFESGEPL